MWRHIIHIGIYEIKGLNKRTFQSQFTSFHVHRSYSVVMVRCDVVHQMFLLGIQRFLNSLNCMLEKKRSHYFILNSSLFHVPFKYELCLCVKKGLTHLEYVMCAYG